MPRLLIIAILTSFALGVFAAGAHGGIYTVTKTAEARAVTLGRHLAAASFVKIPAVRRNVV